MTALFFMKTPLLYQRTTTENTTFAPNKKTDEYQITRNRQNGQ